MRGGNKVCERYGNDHNKSVNSNITNPISAAGCFLPLKLSEEKQALLSYVITAGDASGLCTPYTHKNASLDHPSLQLEKFVYISESITVKETWVVFQR